MTTDYGYDALTYIPPEMNPWGLQLITPEASEFGEYALVGCEQASIETHHQVEVVDEDGRPLRGVWVIFGFGSGKSINMPPRINYWRNGPTVLKGNAQRTNAMGYVQHTFGEGGEDIFIWGRNKEGDLLYPSAIVKNCTWQRTPVAMFEHTGVALRFQLRRAGVIPLSGQMAELKTFLLDHEGRITALEGKSAEDVVLGSLEPGES